MNKPRKLQDIKHDVTIHKYEIENYIHAIYIALKSIFDKSTDVNRAVDKLRYTHEDIIDSEYHEILNAKTRIKIVDKRLELSNCGGTEYLYYTSKLQNLRERILRCEHDLRLIDNIIHQKKSISYVNSIQIKNIKD
jgi:hypothetical protein